VAELLELLAKANYLTAEAAAKALSLLPSPLPQAVLTETQEQQVAAYGGRRLGVVLHGLFAANPKAGTALAAKLLEDAAASNAEGRIESLANALRYPPLHRDAALAQTVVPQLTACCKQADPYAIGSLCAVLKRLPADLVAPAAAIAMGKVDTAKAPHHVVEAALQACSSGMVSEAAKALTAYAGGLMSDYRKNREYGAFIMGRCPRELAIAELRSIYTPKSFGSPKSKAFFFKALKNMHGDAGKKLAAELAEPKAAGGQQGD
jgi:hypothetical protein